MSQTRKRLLLHLLEEAGDRGVTTSEILNAGVGSRYGARLLELREDGYMVESRRERQSSFRYVLHGVGRGGGVEGSALSDAGAPSRQATPSPSVDRLFTPSPRPHYDEAA